jgi:hypothetical protein
MLSFPRLPERRPGKAVLIAMRIGMDSRAYSAEVKPSGYEGRIRSGMTENIQRPHVTEGYGTGKDVFDKNRE